MKDSIAAVDELLLERQQNDQAIVLDGAVDRDRYLRATPRILWILREPNGPGPWDLREYFRSTLFTYNRWQSTAGLMIRVTHGLLQGEEPWGAWADEARKIADCLRDVAVININKRGGDSRVDWSRLYQASLDFGDLICRQVEALRPQIVILAGSWEVLPSDLKSRLGPLDSSDANSTKLGDTVFIRAYHPNQMRITHADYYQRVCNCLAEARRLDAGDSSSGR